ncbi:hypothetical protein GLYMA_15G141900v4 [Glycine max]|uniref:Uncharacterized protein n=2 Tax=Glycine subgen. Soja TaxID=1462606 RepID=C6SX62_SOYBN|nr:uncharacterized protein LOC100305921 [Glycine max]ACU13835.1 unknown [Glycine max]KAH1147129.1 hypothetical protein GYH30_042342 [Glycine max]KRH11961.1 hypothetical protein GLYMA_15G141900v4 [Glycine max]RZB64582.1 hypothetical protein D0Y65_040890 [Glycine soja]|eukprot:NP_001234963.1 uncharacterized protein LOC100305921 [Glycine max]
MVLQTHITAMAAEARMDQPSTVAIILTTATGMTTHTTTVNALFITVALSMVMATGHISRVALTPQQGTTMVVVMIINYLYLIQYMLASWAKYIICYATLY